MAIVKGSQSIQALLAEELQAPLSERFRHSPNLPGAKAIDERRNSG